MATVNHSQQSFAERDPVVAKSSNLARLDSSAARREHASAKRANSAGPVHSGTEEQQYPVVLRMADVSTMSAAEELVHITSLRVDSALETVGSGRASRGDGAPGFASTTGNAPNSSATSFASLLAASPSLQRSKPESSTPTVAPQASVSMAPSVPGVVRSYETAPVDQPAAELLPTNSPLQRRVDRPGIKPLRRPFKITRPAWMPEIPPTLVLGLLICFTALLIGMLWRGNDFDSPPNLAPAAHDAEADQPEGGAAAPAKVAGVPEVPVSRDKASAKAAEKVKVTAAKPSTKKVSKAKPKAKSEKPVEVASKLPAKTQPAAEAIPAPKITGIRPLPPVETSSPDPFYGQPVGGPAPHIVENPHVSGQNPIYEARRPTAQFQGTITPPDAAAPHERY